MLLLTSAPEAYYFHTKLSTHSLNDNHPFIYIDESLNEKEVLVIQDTAMRDLFPNFSLFLDNNLQNKLIDQFWVGENFHFATKSVPENYPVRIYQIQLNELRQKI